MNKYYLYAFMRLDKLTIFYLGKGTGNRINEIKKRNTRWKRIYEKYPCKSFIIIDQLEEKEAYNLERKYIARLKKIGQCEANIALGGDGVMVEKRWWGDKISKSLMGINRPTGKTNKSYKDFANKQTLYTEYVNNGLNTTEIAKKYNVSCPTVAVRLAEYNIKVNSPGRSKIKIKCLNDNKIFNSINEAARHYNVYRENIKKVLLGKYKQTNKLKFATL